MLSEVSGRDLVTIRALDVRVSRDAAECFQEFQELPLRVPTTDTLDVIGESNRYSL